MRTENKSSITFLVIIMSLICVWVSWGSSGYVQPSDVAVLSWANTAPATGSAVVKCTTASATGGLVGVALTGSSTANASTMVALSGVYLLPVRATPSAIGVGDFVWTTYLGAGTCTASLSNTNTGLLFGQSMTALVASSSTQTGTILIRQPAP